MLLGILTLITALSISAVAIYYSVAGLMAIFAAAAVPIMIMGGVLEISKLVTAVWLHKHWKQATWWLKTYLSTSVFVLMLITSMGIFGFLSKAHIEQTAQSTDNLARIETIQSEIDRQLGIIGRAENRIRQLESSETGADASVQSQIDREQERIDRAFERINPAIAQQNQIITNARTDDATRTKPYEDQLASITAEVLRLEQSARDYEDKIANLDADSSGVEPLLAQIAALEEEIIRVTNQLNSKEQQQIRAGQAIIGVTSDGLFGGNTRTALATWVSGQRERIAQIQGEVAQVRKDAVTTVDAERERLADVVKDIRTVQIPALKERELTMLGKIDEVRQTESPAIQTARDEIQRLRKSAESQVEQSQALIARLQQQLANSDNADEIQTAIDEQNERVRTASNEVESLTQEKISLESEYRKLEAEVGPIKYIAEFVYGESADSNMLEEAVRWVILIIIFVFDPLAVLLLIASQYTFEFNRKRKDDSGERLRREYEQARAQRIVDNPGVTFDDPVPSDDTDEDSVSDQEEEQLDVTTNTTTADDDSGNILSKDDTTDTAESDTTVEQPEVQADEVTQVKVETIDDNSGKNYIEGIETATSQSSSRTDDPRRSIAEGMALAGDNQLESKKKIDSLSQEESKEERERRIAYETKEQDETFQVSKKTWKQEHPHLTLKHYKDLYIKGVIDQLPWEHTAQEDNYNVEGYKQNSEQNENTLFNKLKK